MGEKEKVWVASAEYKEIEQIEKPHREEARSYSRRGDDTTEERTGIGTEHSTIHRNEVVQGQAGGDDADRCQDSQGGVDSRLRSSPREFGEPPRSGFEQKDCACSLGRLEEV